MAGGLDSRAKKTVLMITPIAKGVAVNASEPVVILVNIVRSIQRPEMTVETAARRAWNPHTAERGDVLKNADIVVAVAMNVIRGVFKVKDAHPDKEFPDRIAFNLVPVPKYAGLVGVRLHDDGPMWLSGDRSAWKQSPVKYLDALLTDPEQGYISLGGNKISLLADGSLSIVLVPGASIEVKQESMPSLRARLEPLVKALHLTEFCTTTQVLAEALGSSAQAVAKSLDAGKVFTNSEAARVLPPRYRKPNQGWVIPPNDELNPEKTIETAGGPIEDPDPYRGHYLVEDDIGVQQADGSVTVENHFVITNPITLRRFLQS